MARRRRKEAGFVPIFHARAYYIKMSPLLLVFLQIERNTAQVNSAAYQCTSAQQLQKTSTRQLIHSKTIYSKAHPLKSSPTQKLTNSFTPKLKNLIFILQCYSNSRAILAKVLVKK